MTTGIKELALHLGLDPCGGEKLDMEDGKHHVLDLEEKEELIEPDHEEPWRVLTFHTDPLLYRHGQIAGINKEGKKARRSIFKKLLKRLPIDVKAEVRCVRGNDEL